MRRKFLSVVLCVCMMLTMAPFAFAEEGISASDRGSSVGNENVAKINNTEYATLQNAVNAAQENDTILVLSDTDITATGLDIPSNKVVTLDLNGHEVKAANTNNGNIQVQGKLILKDSTDKNKTGEGQGKITTSSIYAYGTVDKVLVCALNGEFVMESGLIDAATNITDNKNKGQFAVGVQNESQKASVTINGGKIKAGWYAIAGNGSCATYDGDITVNGGILESTADYAIYHPQAGTTTINGGVIYGQSGGIAINRGTLVVNDGMITSKGIGSTGSWGDGTGNLNNAAIHANAKYGDVSVSIKNGKVIAEGNAVTIDQGTGHNATVAISGGTFSSDVSQYCEKNYYTEKNDDNTYSVKSTKDVAVAQIGDTYYRTLTDAYAALPRGTADAPAEATTITLLKDSAGGGIGSDTDKYMNYVIDFNGHTYTVGAPAVGSTGTVSQGLRVMKTSTAKFMNGTLKAANYENLIQVVHTYGDVTFQDFTVDASEDAYAWAAVEPDAGTLKVLGNSSILARKGQYGLYTAFWHTSLYDGTIVDVDTTGKITGKLAYEFDEDYSEPNKATENKGFLNIKNGYFDVISIEEIWSDVDDRVNRSIGGISISGGYFTVDPTDYVADSYTAVETTEPGYNYEVVQARTEKADVATAKPDVTKPDGLNGADLAAATAVSSALVNSTNTVVGDGLTAAANTIANDNDITTETGKTALENNHINTTGETTRIVIQTYMDIDITAVNTTNNTLTLDITPMYRTVATTTSDDNAIKLAGENVTDANAVLVGPAGKLTINKPVTVSIPLPTNFITTGNTVYVQHKGYEYTATVTTDAQGTKIATFTNPHGFSSFTITATSTAVATIGGTSYTSLQAAVDAANDNDTITLKQDCAENVTVSKNLKFTLANTDKFSGSINAGSRYNVTSAAGAAANTTDYTVTYVSGSSSGSISAPTTYAVNVNAATNGAVAADKKTASKGTTVTVTASPSKGYVVDAVKVVDKDGKDVAVTEKDGKYVFTMPASAVTVTGSFKAETPAPVALPFTDVKSGNWFYDAVKYAYAQGLMTGTSATTFAPNGTMNRAMIVTVLYRLEKSPAVTGASKFTDVPAGQWYSDAVAWAAANKIVNGYDETTFGPMNAVTREQMAAILFRYEQVKGLENVTLEENLNRFPDQNKISAYAIPALQWAVGQKIINGNADGTLDPTGTATRAQVAQIFTNLLNK